MLNVFAGRKTDMLKLWLMWKARGDRGMAETIEHCFGRSVGRVGRMHACMHGWMDGWVYVPTRTYVSGGRRALHDFSFLEVDAQRMAIVTVSVCLSVCVCVFVRCALA